MSLFFMYIFFIWLYCSVMGVLIDNKIKRIESFWNTHMCHWGRMQPWDEFHESPCISPERMILLSEYFVWAGVK
jgi:hypothetical protein